MFWYNNSADHKWNGSLTNSLPHCFSVISKLWDIVLADVAQSFIHVSGVAYYSFLFPWKFCWVSSCRRESLFTSNLDLIQKLPFSRSVGWLVSWCSFNCNQQFKTKHIFLVVFQKISFAILESRKLFCFGVQKLQMWVAVWATSAPPSHWKEKQNRSERAEIQLWWKDSNSGPTPSGNNIY